jgi:WD40 repeat protein
LFSGSGKTEKNALGKFETHGEIRQWDLDTGKEMLVLRGHSGTVLSLALSPDGQRLYSGSGEFNKGGEIKVWRVAR